VSNVTTVYRPLFGPSQDLGNVTSATQFKNSQGGPFVLVMPNDGQFSNHRLRLHLGGRVQTTTNLNFTLNVYFGSSTTFGAAAAIASNTLLYTTNAATVNTVKSNYHLDIDMFWDNDGKIICGIAQGQIANAIVGPGALANIPVADPNLHNTSNSFQGTFYGITVAGLFSGSSAGNHAYLDVFNLENI
jgi:hypothetical protein